MLFIEHAVGDECVLAFVLFVFTMQAGEDYFP